MIKIKHIELWYPLILDDEKTNYIISTFGNIYDIKNNECPKTKITKKGYVCIYLRLKSNNNKIKTFKLHRIVAKFFIPNLENKPEVNHIDGNKTNNCVWNLEWATTKENVNHAFKTGLHPIYTCEKSSHHIYTNFDIENVCKYMFENPNIYLKDVEKMFDIKYSTLQNLKLHRSWKEISTKFKFKNRLQRKKTLNSRFNDYSERK